MPEIIISDTSCLVLLNKISQIDLLRLCYQTVYITPDILQEYGNPVPDWIIVEEPKDVFLQKTLEQVLDKGEASALTLAIEKQHATIILDDLRARKVAKSLNLKITGTLGVLVKAKQDRIIAKVKPLVNELQKTDFRVSPNIIQEILKVCGE
ncbi:MAG: DUF3368 domain-containing protein [Chitinophagales bacterium]|nr:DUF3368 domain-containing protein [Chitinophagales bacterium]